MCSRPLTPGSAMSSAESVLAGWVGAFADALAVGDGGAVARLFAEESYWRDLVAFSWTIRTFEGRAAIRALVADRALRIGPAIPSRRIFAA